MCKWTERLENLKEFFGFLNNVHPSMKFTMEYSQKQINFLDVLISENNKETILVTSLFTKSTNNHQYLHATSCHGSIYKKLIPHFFFFFFFYLGFLSQTFTIHGTAGEAGGYLFNSSLPLPPALRTLRH